MEFKEPKKFLGQDFVSLRDRYLRNDTLFKDPKFPAKPSSIWYSRTCDDIEWKRPRELVANAELFVDGASRFDINQGELGNCWLLSAIANLSLNQEYLDWVVPSDQSFKDDAGIFHFRIWQYGEWLDVVIDDRLPTRNGKLVFVHSLERNEFWSALLEKAYAKIHGSYEALEGGKPYEALVDYTGGIPSVKRLVSENSSKLFTTALKAHERQSLICCSTPSGETKEAELPNGLILGHAYSVTRVKKVSLQEGGEANLIRVRNPWGSKFEWKGAWSDKSSEWQNVSQEEKDNMLTVGKDGEFWMDFHDFSEHFRSMDIVHLVSDNMLHGPNSRKEWGAAYFRGSWVSGISAGGQPYNEETFHTNPQYRVFLEDPDDEDGDDTCNVLVSVMQEFNRSMRKKGEKCKPIGFQIYRVNDPESTPQPLSREFFNENEAVVKTGFIVAREVSDHVTLKVPATYVVVPCTHQPNQEAKFLLRIYAEVKKVIEGSEDVGAGMVGDEESDDDEEEEEEAKVQVFFE